MNINFLYASKHREERFFLYIPKYMHKPFAKYKKQLFDHRRFLRNWSHEVEACEQKMEVTCPRTKFCRMIEEKLVKEYMEHIHVSKKDHPTLLKNKTTTSEKKANSIETSSVMKRKAVDNNTVCSDDSD
eukprot:5439211-Ditylum_brightwellii.AAC.1